ncbi:hypothetical protein ACFFGV_01590 [Pontibacillus salicampi]|uniref:DUF4367 domain-containing protein n=1 Tax=Pontibacillus salicampi TaxID=1449801 RepID=A0ABV6LIT4_9BACI
MKEFQPKWVLLGLCGIAVIIVIVMMFTGLFTTEKKAIEKATGAAKQEVKREDVKVNKELDDISLYLPEKMAVISEESNNLILQEDDQKYILFYNPFEKQTNDTFYLSAKEAKDIRSISSFELKDRFGYIRIIALDDNAYELQVGVGGAKMTTETTKRAMEEDARDMMKMVRSIQYTANQTSSSS